MTKELDAELAKRKQGDVAEGQRVASSTTTDSERKGEQARQQPRRARAAREAALRSCSSMRACMRMLAKQCRPWLRTRSARQEHDTLAKQADSRKEKEFPHQNRDAAVVAGNGAPDRSQP